jgi:hypothetical protein
MPLLKLDFQPGINKENTPYSTEGGWEDSDKIRFRAGKPQKIGGWEKYLTDQLIGVPRALHIWRALDGTTYTAIGTHIKVYVDTGGVYSDITPLRETQALTNPFTTTASSATITVTDVAHGADDGAYVTISGSTSVDGIPDTEINAEHVITYVDADTYTITVTTTATTGGVTGGGASVSAAYQINPGQIDGLYQYGFGAGAWGAGTFGTVRTTGVSLSPRTWSMTNWGEDLIFSYLGGPVFVWDTSAGGNTRATEITQAPSKNNFVTVTKDRHLVCLGCNDPSDDSSAIDTMNVRWCSQEDYTDWVPVIENTAGSQLLTGGTQILSCANIEGQTMIWTDEDMHSMQYIGPPYTFGFQQIGTSTGIVSPNAWIAYNNSVFWMGQNSFYVFAGGVNTMPCSVQRFVFDSLSEDQSRKVFACLNREFHEITWFYPTKTIEDTTLNGAIGAADTTITVATTAGYQESGEILIGSERITYTGKTDTRFTGCTRGYAGTTAAAHADDAAVSENAGDPALEPCRYVTYSILEQTWWVGRLERTAWKDKGALKYPIATNRGGYLFNHEFGYDAETDPLVAFIESSDFDLGEGDQMMFIHRVLPDFTIDSGSVDLKFRSRYYPLSSQVNETVGNVTNSTTKIDTRIRGRQMAFRIESDETGDWWKYGSTRIDQRPDGRR